MQTFMAIMSQLFWGVTVGALSATFSSVAKLAAAIALPLGAMRYLRRRRTRSDRDEN